MSPEQLGEVVEDKVANLMEHFDCVQILVSYPSGEGSTCCIKRGAGNWYARHAMAEEFVRCHREESAAETMARAINPEES